MNHTVKEIKYSPISLLESLCINKHKEQTYHIFSREDAKLVAMYINAFYMGKPFSVSYWDKSEQWVAFKTRELSSIHEVNKLRILEDHKASIDELFNEPVDKTNTFYKDIQLLIESVHNITCLKTA